MNKENIEFLLRVMADSQRDDLQGHPSDDVLRAFAHKSLSPEDDDGVASHVSICRSCSDKVDKMLYGE